MYEEPVYLKDSVFIYKENWVNIVSEVHMTPLESG